MNLNYLNDKHKNSLLGLLQKCEEIIDGFFAKYTGYDYAVEQKEDVKPYHAKPFPITSIHGPTLKKRSQ